MPRYPADVLMMSTWIAVADRLPEQGTQVLIWIPGGGGWPGECTIGYLTDDNEWREMDEPLFDMVPSHWQVLPLGPED